jgi:tetratricopeptide (TPR) repeat protein
MSAAPVAPWTMLERRFLAGALIVAWAMRLLHWNSFAPYAWFDFLGLDALYYDEWAKRILRDGLQAEDPFFMGPLYPYLLAAVYKVFGPSLDAVRHLQVAGSVASVALMHLLARRLAGPTLAMIASGAAAVYGPYVFESVSILYPTLLILLSTALLLLLFEAADRRSNRWAFAAGAVLGTYALGNAAILIFAPFAFFWLLAAWGRVLEPSMSRPEWRKVLPGGVALALGTVLFILPATIHNGRTGDPVLLTTNGGLNFYIGNGPMANGGHLTPILYLERPDGSVQTIEADLTKDVECRTEAELATGRSMKYSEVSSFWFDETMKHVRRHPGTFVAGLVRKFVHFWSTYEIPQIDHFEYFRRWSLPLRGPALTFGVIGPLSVVGMALALRRPRPWLLPYLFTIAYSTSIVLFFVVARYRLPILPALLLFAAFAVVEIVSAVRARRWKLAGGAAGSAAACAWLMQANFYGIDESKGIAQIIYRQGIVEDSRQAWDAAIAKYEEALALKPDYEKGHLNLGVDLARVGRHEEALQHLAEAERLDPGYSRAPYNRGAVLEELGRHDEALLAYARAVEIEPRYLVARLALGEMHFVAGDTASAAAQFAAISEYDGRWDPQQHETVRAQSGKWAAYLEERRRLASSGRGACFEDRLFRLAEVSRIRARIPEALAVLRMYFEAGGHCAEAYAVLGRILSTMDERESSEDALRRALAEDEGFPGVRITLAQMAASRGDSDTAVSQLTEEVRRHPTHPDAYLELGLVHERLRGDAAEAERWFARFREVGGDAAVLQARRAHWTGRAGG